jgi:hypothetical protein
VNSGTAIAIAASTLRFFMFSPGWGISPDYNRQIKEREACPQVA